MALVCTWMGDRSGMSISADSPSDEILNRGPLALLLRRQFEFPFEIDMLQFFFSDCDDIVCSVALLLHTFQLIALKIR